MNERSERTKYRYIRRLRGAHRGARAVILGKGPSLDVWYSRGGCRNNGNDLLLMAINETVLLPGLEPDYWFWKTPDDPRQVERFGPPSARFQVFPARMFAKEPEYAARRAAAHPTLLYTIARHVPDDPYAVPGAGTSGAAAFFCAGLWGCREVLGVGFDAREQPRMRTYASCMIPWATEPENTDNLEQPHVPNYLTNNHAIDVAIRRFDYDVTWYHQQVTEDEIAAAGKLFE